MLKIVNGKIEDKLMLKLTKITSDSLFVLLTKNSSALGGGAMDMDMLGSSQGW